MQPTGYELLQLAEALARVKHAGQVRKGSGEPYFNHLQRVAGRVVGWRAKTIAFLHDVIEDTNLTPTELRHVGFPWDIVDDVVALSRRPWDSVDDGVPQSRRSGGRREEYHEFIDRTIREGSHDALYVKLADLADNMFDPWTRARTNLEARYIKADIMLRAEINRRGLPVPRGVAA